MKKTFKYIVIFIILIFCTFCAYTSISICIKNNQENFDIDHFLREYETYCGKIQLKYESNTHRGSSVCFVVVDNNECIVSRKYYHSCNIGDNTCVTNYYSKPNGYAFIGFMVINLTIIVAIAIIISLFFDIEL